MDNTLKQRLVGAAVITALAAIFVPMLFDDPIEKNGQSIRALEIPPSPEIAFQSEKKSIPTSIDEVLAVPEAEPIKIESAQEGVETTNKVATVNVKPKKDPELIRWVIQIGSFGQRQNALALRDKLRKQGFSAFVDSIEVKEKGTHYRVRVGPELDKNRAQATQRKIEKQYQVKSILISE